MFDILSAAAMVALSIIYFNDLGPRKIVYLWVAYLVVSAVFWLPFFGSSLVASALQWIVIIAFRYQAKLNTM